MIDFIKIATRSAKRGTIEIYPKFIIGKSKDLMIRGGDFYAMWMESKGLWSTDEQDVIRTIDNELKIFADENKEKFGDSTIKVLYMWDAESGMIDKWHKFCQSQLRDNYHTLDENLIFSNRETKKEDYASKKLTYPLESGPTPAYDKLIGTLYSEEERQKIEWAIGSIVSGDSKTNQKFMVLYGEQGTGKSTVINLIEKLFSGYVEAFRAKDLASNNNSFALEAFKNNPLVAIDHEGKLNKIEDNTILNSLVSHDIMNVNEKFKSTYSARFKCFLILASNEPVKITNAKSGLLRRLIDVRPTGNKLKPAEYRKVVKQMNFELGKIAQHCLDVYKKHKHDYDDYIPVNMLGATNDFYNFVLDSYFVFKEQDGVTLKAAWEMYKAYCDDAKVPFPLPKMRFKEELKDYFYEYKERSVDADGNRVRSYFEGFKADKFENESYISEAGPPEYTSWIDLKEQKSIFDNCYKYMPAQYANDEEAPLQKWDNVKTTLQELDTSRTHYVRVPENHIVIDFDIPNDNGEKDLNANLEAASEWPKTYAELSKSGNGLHLHYIYTGDVSKLKRLYAPHIEVKIFNGKSSLRRRLSKCNDTPVSELSSGLPLKEEKGIVNLEVVKSEKSLRNLINKNLKKEIHPGTKPSIDFIFKILNDAYENKALHYDVTDMRPAILAFANNSTHQAQYCIKLVNEMKFHSDEPSRYVEPDKDVLIFFDVEVFPNLFLVCWKAQGEDNIVNVAINPTPKEIENLLQYKLVGFNNRKYDNHILYARLLGYTEEELYRFSKRVIDKSQNAAFREAYNLSYTDIYDFASSGNKMSLKKLEIKMGIHHQELGLPWDEPVPREKWDRVAEYCKNDVIATEAAFNFLSADFTARQILADVAGMTVNDTTNTLTTRIIFGNDRHPQSQFNYRDLGDTRQDTGNGFDAKGRPIFPGYRKEFGKSTYMGENVGEGGYVYSEPGMYGNVALLDIASMHPSTIIAENLFGDIYTQKFKELYDARLAIKHEDYETAKTLLGGKLKPYLESGKYTSKQLANALKTAINSVYGLTSATFDNPFRDPRNADNIVAKRGALFMVNLKHEVQARGYTVAHIKTDSIKIPDATPEIIQFVMDYGKKYGYTFEHEDTYERMCLINDAVYIARHQDGTWTATGKEFAVPYIFKTLFTHEPLEFSDLCETKQVTSELYLDMNEELPDVSQQEKELKKIVKKLKDSGQPVDETKTTGIKEIEDLKSEIAKGHNYIFIGRVGQFCPIQKGCGGGELVRSKDGKYYSVSGCKGYRWLESEMVEKTGVLGDIDMSYFENLAQESIDHISKFGDYEWFVSDDPYICSIKSQPGQTY